MIPSAELVALRDELLALPDDELERYVRSADPEARAAIAKALARPVLEPHQLPPTPPWRTWLFMAGRGSGKSLASACWFDEHMTGPPCDERLPGGHQGLIVAPTQGDATLSCVEGTSGLKVVNPDVKSATTKGGTHAIWPNGARALLLGAHTDEDVDRFRAAGNRCALWAEELAAWRKAEQAWEIMDFSIRTVGNKPPIIAASTTPKKRPLIRQLLSDPNVALTRASMRDNPHLNPQRRQELIDKYEGTRLGRQELEGEFVEDVEGAYFNSENLALHRVPYAPSLDALAIGVDPPGETAECGIVAVGGAIVVRPALPPLVHLYVLGDYTVRGLPEVWAARVDWAYKHTAANIVVFEKNQGWQMGLAVLRQANISLPVKDVVASKGKLARAEPVSLLADKGQFHLVGGPYEALEDQMCSYAGEGNSPDRFDAMVWGATWVLNRLTLGHAKSSAPKRTGIRQPRIESIPARVGQRQEPRIGPRPPG